MEDSTQFIKLASTEDFRDTRIKSFSIVAKPVAIMKDPDGTFWATEIGCKHNNFDLTNGKFNGDMVVCPRHGWKYNIRSGECLNHPSAPLRRYEVELRGTDIYVSMFPIQDSAEDEDEDEDWNFEIKINPSSAPE